MGENDTNPRRNRPKRASLWVVWLIGAIALSIVSGSLLLHDVMPIENSEVYYIIAAGHYPLSLALAFLVFSGLYGIFDVVVPFSYRRALGWGHFGFMAAGAILIVGPSISLQLPLGWLKSESAIRLFAIFNLVNTVGYALTLVGVMLFAILLGDVVVRRLKR